MARDTSGNYTLPTGNPVVTNTTVSSTWANTTMNDLKTEVQDSLSRSGNGAMLAALKHIDGTVGAPSLTFNLEATTGFYRKAANDIRFAVGGTDTLKIISGELSIWNATDSAWYPLADSKTLGSAVEVVTLGASQTVVPFTKNVAGAAIYVDGTATKRGRLFLTSDYTYNATTNEITTLVTHPTGTKVMAVVNDETDVNAAAIACAANATATAADVILTAADAAATAADKIATNADAVSTAADLVATNQDTIDTAADAVATAADRVVTTQDAIDTAADAVATAADKTATNADAVSTAADAAATAADAIATAADRVQTGLDATSAAADAASVDYVTLKSGRKNLILNGNFDIWQRGTSFTASNAYTADRFILNTASTTLSRKTLTTGGAHYAMNLLTAVAGATGFIYRIEADDAAHLVGKQITLSFGYTLNSGDVSGVFGLFQSANVKDTYGAVTTVENKSIPVVSGSRASMAYAVTPDAVRNGLQLALTFNTAAGHDIDISSIQIEEGPAATDFEYRPIGEELALCQRYYYQHTFAQQGTRLTVLGGSFGVTTVMTDFALPSPMRVVPTFTIDNWTQSGLGSDPTGTGTITYSPGDATVGAVLNGSGWAVPDVGRVSFDVVADAEL